MMAEADDSSAVASWKAIFVCASIFASILAYESERSSRARFRSKDKVLATIRGAAVLPHVARWRRHRSESRTC